MTIEEAIFKHLSTYAGLTALVGKNIVPGDTPQSMANQAGVAYFLISDPHIHKSGGDLDVYQPRFQFSCFGTSYSNACAVAAQVKAALQDYSGTMGGTGGVVVQHSFYEDANDLFDTVSGNMRRSGRALDFVIWHE